MSGKFPSADAAVGTAPDAPTNVVVTTPRGRVLSTTWDPPTNFEDVDKYRVRVYQAGSNLRETVYTRGQHHRYHVPEADAGTSHSIKVTAVDVDLNLSTEVTATQTEGGALPDGTPTGAIKWFGAGTFPGGYLRCNGASYSTTTYAALFAVIGYTFGGSGASFNVPDIRRRKISGVGDSADTTLGDNDGAAETGRTTTNDHADGSGWGLRHDTHGSHVGHGGHGAHASDNVGEGAHTHGSGSLQTANHGNQSNVSAMGTQTVTNTVSHSIINNTGTSGAAHSHPHAAGHDYAGGTGHYAHNDHSDHTDHSPHTVNLHHFIRLHAMIKT